MKNMDDELEDMRESYDGLQQKQELYGIRIRAKLKNLEMIPAMFDIFSEYLNKNGIKRNRMTDGEFVFIVLFMYSPKKLFGNNMEKGLRVAIGRTLNRSGICISHLSNEVLFYYSSYKTFHDETVRAYGVICNSLK